MIAASSLRRWRADMAATRDVLGRVGPLRPCIGMPFRPRCQRAGGIPLHLQQGRNRCSECKRCELLARASSAHLVGNPSLSKKALFRSFAAFTSRVKEITSM